MIKKISMLAVMAAAIALVLAGCVKAPATPVSPNLAGTWSFAPMPVVAMIHGNAVTVTVGDGTAAVGMDELAAVTQIVVSGTLAEDEEENTFMLTLAEGDDAIMVTLAPTVPATLAPAVTSAATGAIKGMIVAAQGGTVMIDLDSEADPDTMIVSGSFIDALLTAAGLPVPPTGLMATRVIT